MNWLTITTGIIQALFSITIATVAIYTYVSAKKTILQPIRTEVFKQQLNALNELGQYFFGKSEIELREDLDFTGLFEANVSFLLDNYLYSQFNMKHKEGVDRPYSTKYCEIYLISGDALEPIPDISDSDVDKDNPQPRKVLWADYKHYSIPLTNKHHKMTEELKKIMRNPLLPKQCQKYVSSYLRLIEKNVAAIGLVLDEAAKEFPDRYPTKDALLKLSRSDTAWLDNRYNEKFKSLEPSATKIEGYIREYLGTDQLVVN